MSDLSENARSVTREISTRWVQITCQQREELVCRNGERYEGFKVAASCTDLSGQYGTAQVFTEWYDATVGEESVLRDYRWPHPRNVDRGPDEPYYDDVKPCEHYAVEPSDA